MTGEPIAADDRGLSYGDGLFETMRVVAGRIPLWHQHRARLLAGAGRLGIAVTAARIDAALTPVLAGVGDGIIKIVVTRGRGGRGYSVPAEVMPTLLVQAYPLRTPPPRCYEQGLLIGLCDIRLASQPLLAGIKHLNRLEQVMAASSRSGPAGANQASSTQGSAIHQAGEMCARQVAQQVPTTKKMPSFRW